MHKREGARPIPQHVQEAIWRGDKSLLSAYGKRGGRASADEAQLIREGECRRISDKDALLAYIETLTLEE